MISHDILTSLMEQETSIIDKIGIINTKSLELMSTGLKNDDRYKLSLGIALSSVPTGSLFFQNSIGKYLTGYFVSFVVDYQNIKNETLDDTLDTLLRDRLRDLLDSIENIKYRIEEINDSVGQESVGIINDLKSDLLELKRILSKTIE